MTLVETRAGLGGDRSACWRTGASLSQPLWMVLSQS